MTTEVGQQNTSELKNRLLATSSDKLRSNLKKDENLTADEIEDKEKISKHKRREGIKKCLHSVEIGIIRLVFVVVVVLGFSYFFHLVTPEAWAYLSKEQLEHIRGILFSGVIASVLSSKFKKYFDDSP